MSNPVYEALYAYYETQFADEDSEDYDESALIFDNGVPLDQRKSGILQRIEKLMTEGTDINDAPDGDYPLKSAVCNHDVLMVRYLIQHGADCRKWHAEGEKPDPEERNFYLEALDSAALDESFVTSPNTVLFEVLFEIAVILVKEGGLQEPFSGYCLKITGDREIIMGPAQVGF